jgi:hypothetical protein
MGSTIDHFRSTGGDGAESEVHRMLKQISKMKQANSMSNFNKTRDEERERDDSESRDTVSREYGVYLKLPRDSNTS